MKYISTIGIECHVQLATKTKLFSGADNDAREQEPNSVVSPIDYGLPGMLPVLNREAVELAIKAGLALGCKIAPTSRFDRKHYFYPDLPNGYQITQLYQPIILEGLVTVPLSSGEMFDVRIQRAHLEADAGKLTHYADYSLVDLNRVGTPLIEIISEPDMHSAEQAKLYAQELYLLMCYAGVTHGDLYHGNMRFDVNISVAGEGDSELGKRTEVKNLNSFRAVASVVEFEYKRQTELLEKGKTVEQETRGWDEAKQKTFSQRSKEDAPDYRYMPDPDLPPIVLTDDHIAKTKAEMSVMPNQWRERLSSLELDSTQTGILLDASIEIPDANYLQVLETTLDNKEFAKKVANWLVNDDIPFSRGLEVSNPQVDRVFIYKNLFRMIETGKISSTNAKALITQVLATSDNPIDLEAYASEKGLIQVSDEGEIIKIVDQVLNDNPKAAEDVKNGEMKAIGFLIGQVMKQSKGKANPTLAQKLIRKRL